MVRLDRPILQKQLIWKPDTNVEKKIPVWASSKESIEFLHEMFATVKQEGITREEKLLPIKVKKAQNFLKEMEKALNEKDKLLKAQNHTPLKF
jgi:hypothetical protein